MRTLFLLNVDSARFHEVFYPAIAESLGWFGPELQIVLAAGAILLLDLFIPRGASKHLAWLAVFACVYAAAGVFALHEEERALFLGMIAVDSFANFFKVFFLLGGIPFILISYVSRELDGVRMGEYYAILLTAILGGMLMASSHHLLMAFMSLELLSISSYILVGFHRRSRVGSEAALKYIIYGSVASAMMGFGLSLLYGLSGTALIPQILARITVPGADLSVIVALVLTFLGLAYKMATIPMHFWSPDVYEGAPTPITAFLSVASKAAGFALCMRFFGSMRMDSEAVAMAAAHWPVVLILVAMVTMTLGNLAALWQENVKRLFAYSSIAHAGYMMMGIALLELPGVDNNFGVQAVSFYLLAYLAMNLGAFAVVILFENRTGSVDLKDYTGMGWRAPFLGVSLAVFLFSLVGVPPTAGFTGKFQLFMGVVRTAQASAPGLLQTLLFVMAGVALINTAVSAYYYTKILRNMYLRDIEEGGERVHVPILGSLTVAALLIMTIYLFVDADEILKSTLELKLYTGV